MRKILIGALVVLFALGVNGVVFAGSNDTQAITFTISSINEIDITGAPTFTVDASMLGFTVGQQLPWLTDSSTSFAFTTNDSGKKITGQLAWTGGTPSNVALTIELGDPDAGGSGATPASETALTDLAAHDLLTAIAQQFASGVQITYKFRALVTAAQVTNKGGTVTLTIM